MASSWAYNIYNVWKTTYLDFKVKLSDQQNFENRIRENTTNLKKLEDETRNIHLRRIAEESKIFNHYESPKPKPSIHSYLDFGPRFRNLKNVDAKYFAPKRERPELTQEMLMIVDEASRSHPPNEVLAEIDGVQILRKDIHTLCKLNWLNDEVVNAYLSLLVARGQKESYKKVYAFNTFFYPKLRETGYTSIRRWTRKVDIFSYDYLLVPVHLGNHWCLAFVDFTNRTISYYDSLGGQPHGACDTMLEYLRYESNDKKKQDFDDENWRLIDKYSSDNIPLQYNGSDCGVFACTYAEYLTRRAKLTFKQEHMPYFRKKMIYELLSKRILE